MLRAPEPHLSQVAMQKITTEKQSLEVANAKLRVAVWLKGVTWDLLFPRFSTVMDLLHSTIADMRH